MVFASHQRDSMHIIYASGEKGREAEESARAPEEAREESKVERDVRVLDQSGIESFVLPIFFSKLVLQRQNVIPLFKSA